MTLGTPLGILPDFWDTPYLEYSRKIENREIGALPTNLCDANQPSFVDFLLDCSTLPEVIAGVQQHGHVVLHHLFRVTQIWVYVLHRERLKLLGRWNNFP